MKILKISLQNLNSLRGTHHLDFTSSPLADSGLFAITGQTGAGKSTILDAITLALYARTSRDHAGDIMTYGEREAYGLVEIQKDAHRYRARFHRSLTRGGNQKEEWEFSRYDPETDTWPILETKKNKLKSTKDRPGVIEQHLGLNYEQFLRSVILAQGEFAAFLKADSGNRAALLERITGTEIYTRISVAAHERHREEKQRIQRAEDAVRAIELLSAEELTDLKQRIDTQQELIKTETGRHEELRRFQDFFKQLNQVRQTTEKLTRQRNGLEQRRPQFEQQEQRLLRDLATRPFADLLARRREQQEQLDRAQAAVERVEGGLPSLREQLEAQETQLREIRERVQAVRDEETEKLPKLREAERLDEQLRAIKNALSALREDAARLETRRKTNEQEQRNLNTTLSQIVTRREQADKFFADHPRVESLPQILRKVQPSIQGLTATNGVLAHQQESLTTTLDDLQKTERTIDGLERRLQELGPVLAHARAEFRELTGQPSRTDTSDVLQEMEQQIERYREQQQTIKQQQRDLEQIEQQRTTLSAVREKVDEIRLTLDALEDRLEKTEQERSETELALDVLRPAKRIEELEQEIDTLREQLSAGEPCPVCGATEHHPDHLTSTTRTSVAKQFQQLEEKQTRLRDEATRIRADIATNRKRAQQVDEDGTAQELELVRLQKLFEATYTSPQPEPLPDLQELEAQRRQAARLDRYLGQLEQEIGQMERSRQEQQGRLDTLLARRTQLETESRNLQRTAQDHQQILAQQLEMFGYAEPADLTTVNKLSEQTERMLQHRQEATGEEREVQLKLQAAIEGIRPITDDQNLTHKKISKEENNLQQLQIKRTELIGDAEVAQVRAELANRRSTAEQQEEATRLKSEAQRQQLARAETELTTLKEQSRKHREALDTTDRQFETLLKDSDFETIEAVQQAQLPEPERQRLTDETQQFRQERTALEARLQDQQQQLTQLESAPPTELSEAELADLFTQQSRQLDELKDALGGWKNQLSDHEQKVAKNEQLTKEYRRQKRELDRWARLHDLIGSGDGKKFRVFAQGLTLQNLLYLANRQLRHLDPRYQIQNKPGGENLELEIVDTYQANNVRSTNTLSGGETFLVSLALALGLSDLAGRNTQIESLFIDEGFGTLDGQTLDSVITTLENLQSSGKTIGIISHVSELKERIGTQVRVLRGVDGFSEVKVR